MILEIENLREKLNKILSVNNCASTEVLAVSQEMDALILRYMNQESQRESKSQ